jgi:hypothetical protein
VPLEVLAIAMAFAFRLPPDRSPGLVRLLGPAGFGVISAALSWTSVCGETAP